MRRTRFDDKEKRQRQRAADEGREHQRMTEPQT